MSSVVFTEGLREIPETGDLPFGRQTLERGWKENVFERREKGIRSQRCVAERKDESALHLWHGKETMERTAVS